MSDKKKLIDIKKVSENTDTVNLFKEHLEKVFGYSDTIGRLEIALSTFEQGFKNALSENEFLDKDLAIELLNQAKALLAVCKNNSYKNHVPYSLAAISYLVCSEDAICDFTELDGLEDDQEVLNFVINAFSLDEEVQVELKKIINNKEVKSA